jgi:hypothetical protein
MGDRPVLSEALILRQAQDERRVEGLTMSVYGDIALSHTSDICNVQNSSSEIHRRRVGAADDDADALAGGGLIGAGQQR